MPARPPCWTIAFRRRSLSRSTLPRSRVALACASFASASLRRVERRSICCRVAQEHVQARNHGVKLRAREAENAPPVPTACRESGSHQIYISQLYLLPPWRPAYQGGLSGGNNGKARELS